MNEDFVSFDLAKKLKEKGFRYNKNNLLDKLCMENQINHPSIAQVLKWLREEKKIYLELIIVGAEYMCNIYKIEPRPVEWVGSTEYYKTYEAAAIAGIDYYLDTI